jgi:Mce-associated membrane protein
MSEAKEPPKRSVSKAETMALLEEAEAEAAEAEALAAAARARARVARLRREAQAEAEAKVTEAAEPGEASDEEGPDADDTVKAETDVEAETDEDASDETIEAPESKSRLVRWRRRLPSLSAASKVAIIILICAFAVASGYMMWEDHAASERAQRAANFVAGARQGVINMTSLDSNRAKDDVQRVIDGSTGQFRDDFQRRAKDFIAVVEQSKEVTQGVINAAALESMGEHSASVLVSAISKITNAAGTKDEPRVFRLRVTVTESEGQYKMSKVDFVP